MAVNKQHNSRSFGGLSEEGERGRENAIRMGTNGLDAAAEGSINVQAADVQVGPHGIDKISVLGENLVAGLRAHMDYCLALFDCVLDYCESKPAEMTFAEHMAYFRKSYIAELV